VGSAAQSKVIRKFAGNLKLELAQFREVEDFTKLGFALDDATKRLVDRGTKLTKALVQNRFVPLPVPNQVVFLYAVLNGFLDGISADLVQRFEQELLSFLPKTCFQAPFSYYLRKSLDEEVMTLFLTFFRKYFILYLV